MFVKKHIICCTAIKRALSFVLTEANGQVDQLFDFYLSNKLYSLLDF